MSGLVDNTSPQYFVRKWRSVSIEDEAALEDFLAWLQYDDEASEFENNLKTVKAIVDAYLGRNMKKITQGERELLKAWKEAVNQ